MPPSSPRRRPPADPHRADAADRGAAPHREDGSPGLLWTRAPEEKPEGLTRQAIVASAIRLADAEGLDAVSIRRVAGELEVRPMSLYSHIVRKDDLLDLMLDEVVGELIAHERLPGDWRDALRVLAHRTRAVALAHPWVVNATSMRPRMGPNALRHTEQSLAAFAEVPVPTRRKRELLAAVDDYVLGHVTRVNAERGIAQREGMSQEEWQQALLAYFGRLTSSGQFPYIAEYLAADSEQHEEDDAFTVGLEALLYGIAAAIGEQSAAPTDGVNVV